MLSRAGDLDEGALAAGDATTTDARATRFHGRVERNEEKMAVEMIRRGVTRRACGRLAKKCGAVVSARERRSVPRQSENARVSFPRPGRRTTVLARAVAEPQTGTMRDDRALAPARSLVPDSE